jgi:hypothetical protein
MLNGANVSVIDLIRNLVFVTLGNLAGGCLLAMAYWFAYLDDGTSARGLAAASRPALRLIGSMQQAVASRAARILGSNALERMTPLDSTTRAQAPTEMDVH